MEINCRDFGVHTASGQVIGQKWKEASRTGNILGFRNRPWCDMKPLRDGVKPQLLLHPVAFRGGGSIVKDNWSLNISLTLSSNHLSMLLNYLFINTVVQKQGLLQYGRLYNFFLYVIQIYSELNVLHISIFPNEVNVWFSCLWCISRPNQWFDRLVRCVCHCVRTVAANWHWTSNL